jgi:hypothetical protein
MTSFPAGPHQRHSAAGRRASREALCIILFPGAAISLAAFAFNFLRDSVRDWLNPDAAGVSQPISRPP